MNKKETNEASETGDDGVTVEVVPGGSQTIAIKFQLSSKSLVEALSLVTKAEMAQLIEGTHSRLEAIGKDCGAVADSVVALERRRSDSASLAEQSTDKRFEAMEGKVLELMGKDALISELSTKIDQQYTLIMILAEMVYRLTPSDQRRGSVQENLDHMIQLKKMDPAFDKLIEALRNAKDKQCLGLSVVDEAGFEVTYKSRGAKQAVQLPERADRPPHITALWVTTNALVAQAENMLASRKRMH